MSVVQKTVNIVTSVDNFLALMVIVASDVKTGKAPAQVVTDAIPGLVKALTGIGDLGKDVLDKKDLETTIALKLSELVNVFV